jgi:hypothetical protein
MQHAVGSALGHRAMMASGRRHVLQAAIRYNFANW